MDDATGAYLYQPGERSDSAAIQSREVPGCYWDDWRALLPGIGQGFHRERGARACRHAGRCASSAPVRASSNRIPAAPSGVIRAHAADAVPSAEMYHI